MDSCDGHPSPNGHYHYHQMSGCVHNNTNNEFMGVALDGFPIYGIKVKYMQCNVIDAYNVNRS